jgi:hypothetical protein
MFDRLMADFYAYSNKIPKLMMIDKKLNLKPAFLTIFDRSNLRDFLAEDGL